MALAAKRVALGKSQTTACLEISKAFLHAEMRDEVYVKLNPDTLQLIREDSFTNLQTVDSGGIHRVNLAFYGYRGSLPLWKHAVSNAAKDLGLNQAQQD